MFSTPVKKTNRPDPTSSARLSRSTAWAAVLTAGRSHSVGMTDHSFARRIGMAATPATTCTPWVSA
jgi:hypothetical protein